MKMPAIDRRSLIGGLWAAAVASVPALASIASPTREALRAKCLPGINPKLIALAAAFAKAGAEFHYAFDVLAVSDEQLFFNREDATEAFSEIVATNLNELCLEARYAEDSECIAESIIRDLLAIDGKRSATVTFPPLVCVLQALGLCH